LIFRFVYTAKSDYAQNVLSARCVIFIWISGDIGWDEIGKSGLGKEP